MRALAGGVLLALAFACSVLEPVDDYEGPPLAAGGGGTSSDAGADVSDAVGTDAKCSTPDDCDDQNPCTADGCWGNLCTHAPTPGVTCADSNVCNGDEVCGSDGTCEKGLPLQVDDDDPCTDDACDPVKGVTHIPQATPPMQILQCGSVTCPAGYYVKKLTCLSECGACNPTFCVNGTLCERVCKKKLDVCCNNTCDDCPPGYSQTATFMTGDCGCGPGQTASCER